MKCENTFLKGVEVPGKPHPNTTIESCTNEASPGLVFCRGCLWQHSEELYKADRERRAQEAQEQEEAPAPAPTPEPTPEREEGKKANDPQWYIDRIKKKKRRVDEDNEEETVG